MDKMPVYPGAIPLDVNVLQPQRNVELALGYLMQAAFGTTTLIDGLAVTPTAPASMGVSVGPGSIIFYTTVDTVTTGFGSLPVDNADPLVKIGINLASTTMGALTAPSTVGWSQNWLVEAQFLEADGSPVVLPFYNSVNPAQPYTGPSNSGATSNTARTNTVQLQWKGGTAAATGTQNTPTPDAGWVGVAVVTLTNGQSSIVSGNISPYGAAPYVPTKLSQTRVKLTGNLNLYVAATGGSDTSGSGLSANSPWATLQRAWNYLVNSVDMNGYNATINVANGTYTSGVVCQGAPVGFGSGNSISFVGNTTTPSNCAITVSNQHCFYVLQGVAVNLAGFQLSASGTYQSNPACGILLNGGQMQISGNITFGTCSGMHLWASGGMIDILSGYTIAGGAQAHYYSTTGGLLNTIAGASLVVTLSGTPTFSTAFAVATMLGAIQLFSSNITFGGSGATGPRYVSTTNGVINSSGSGASFFPGSTAGSVSTGGQYA